MFLGGINKREIAYANTRPYHSPLILTSDTSERKETHKKADKHRKTMIQSCS